MRNFVFTNRNLVSCTRSKHRKQHLESGFPVVSNKACVCTGPLYQRPPILPGYLREKSAQHERRPCARLHRSTRINGANNPYTLTPPRSKGLQTMVFAPTFRIDLHNSTRLAGVRMQIKKVVALRSREQQGQSKCIRRDCISDPTVE